MKSVLINIITAFVPSLFFYAMEYCYDWSSRSPDYWQNMADSFEVILLTSLGGSFGAVLGALLLPGLLLVFTFPNMYLISINDRLQLKGLLFTLLFFGVPLMINFMRYSMKTWNW